MTQTTLQIKVTNSASYKIKILKAVLKFINWLPQRKRAKPKELIINMKLEAI